MKITRMTVLSDLIRRHNWQTGAELGVWQGALFGHLLKKHPDLYLIGVDNWRPVGTYAAKNMKAAEAQALAICFANAGRSRIIKMSTVEAAGWIDDGALDFVFIDASHDTDSVIADIRAWRSKIAKGGALTGHDANWPTVQDALNEELPGWQTLEANVWIYRFA